MPSALQSPRRLPSPMTEWDAERTYPVAVVLVSFSDRDFSDADAAFRYHRMFNEPGYNEGAGPGCVAEYFAEQSGGLFHPRFDVYGPVKISAACTANGNYGPSAFQQAAQLLADSLQVAFEPYDWNADGNAESFIFIYAGYGGNEVANNGKGYIWPNTGSFSMVMAGSTSISGYSASAEIWADGTSCGIGTICHEFSHTLGLPDIYPTAGSEYSVCDEWDLMDGGNFTDNGWCPPGYSAHERMLLGWLQPEMLDEPTLISHLAPLRQGGRAFLIPTESDSEFYLLENRQWTGWDLFMPGHGLLVSHVDFDAWAWQGNTVNNAALHHRYDLLHADNLSYNDWENLLEDGANRYDNQGHCRYLSGTAYPYLASDVANDSLTDQSTPAATTFCASGFLSKPITSIKEAADGTISFSFQHASASGIRPTGRPTDSKGMAFDLQGRRLPCPALLPAGTPYIKDGRKHQAK